MKKNNNVLFRIAFVVNSVLLSWLSFFALGIKELDLLGQSYLKYLFTHQLIMQEPTIPVSKLVQVRDILLSHEYIDLLSEAAEVTDFVECQGKFYLPTPKKRNLNFGFRAHAAALLLEKGFDKASEEVVRYTGEAFEQDIEGLRKQILTDPKANADLLEWFGDALLEWRITKKLVEEEWPEPGAWRSILCSNLMIRICAFPDQETLVVEQGKSTHDYGRAWEIKLGLKYFKKSGRAVNQKINEYVQSVLEFARKCNKKARSKGMLLSTLFKKTQRMKVQLARGVG